MRFLIFLLINLFLLKHVSAQSWTVEMDKFSKIFVENKGQVESKNTHFILNTDGFEYHFHSNGYSIIKKEWLKSDQVALIRRAKQENEDEERNLDLKTTIQEIKFLNTNNNASIFSSDQVDYHFSYSIRKDHEIKTFHANGYRKIHYKNIYDRIDLIFEIPTDSVGIKYSFVLNPGADPSDIQLFYAHTNDIAFNNGTIEIDSKLGKIIENKPLTFSELQHHTVSASYTLKNKVIGFKIDREEIKEKIIIDPWTLVMVSGQDPYSPFFDVDVDSFGNRYAYGKCDVKLSLYKFSNNGTLIWIYQPLIFMEEYDFYGDFVVDKNTNTIFLTEGYRDGGARVIKLDENANQLAMFPGNTNFQEMWRISTNSCTNQIVIAGGGTTTPSYETCMLDMDLQNMEMVQYLPGINCCRDVCMLALDDFGNSFQILNSYRYDLNSDPIGNLLIKLPLPNLQPALYIVPSEHDIRELASVRYHSDVNRSNGYNGIACYQNLLFTYNSHELKKRNALDGSTLLTKIVNPNIVDPLFIDWGGLAVDLCGRIYVGLRDSVHVYDTNLVLLQKIQMPNFIYDIAVGLDGNVTVSGNNFIKVFEVENKEACNYLKSDLTKTDAFCKSLGSITLDVSGGTPPYSLSVNNIPQQFTTEILNLPEGTYTITVTDAACKSKGISSNTVEIKNIASEEIKLKNVNVFTVNNDLINELFYPFLELDNPFYSDNIVSYKLEITDRWGVLVFETNDFHEGWTGLSAKDQSCTEGVYFWTVHLRFDCTEDKTYSGFVHIVK